MKRRTLAGAGIVAALSATLALRSTAAPDDGTAMSVPEVDVEFGPPVPPSFFGMHFHRLVPDVAGGTATPWPESLVGSLRVWDAITRWGDVSPAPARWEFARLDAYVEAARQRSASVLYTLGSTPRWASARPDEPGPYGQGCAAEPRRMADWEEYVRRVAVRYRGRIAAYEIWNEPYFSDFAADRGALAFFSGSVERLVEMARVARRVLSEVDPAALLVSPGFVSGSHRMAAFLGRGGAPLIDVMAYHFYSRDMTEFASEAAEVRRVMAVAGIGQLPLWNTETGIVDVAPVGAPAPIARQVADDAAARLSQFLLLAGAGGLGRFYYHAWDNDLSGLVDRIGRARGPRDAYARTRSWMLGTSLGPARRVAGDAVRIDGRSATTRVAFLFAPERRRLDLRLAPGWRVAGIESVDGRPTGPVTVDGGTTRFDIDRRPARVRFERA